MRVDGEMIICNKELSIIVTEVAIDFMVSINLLATQQLWILIS